MKRSWWVLRVSSLSRTVLALVVRRLLSVRTLRSASGRTSDGAAASAADQRRQRHASTSAATRT